MTPAEMLLAGDPDPDAFDDAVAADPTQVQAVLALAEHPDPDVRRRVAEALPSLSGDEAPAPALVAAAVRLSADPVEEVRDWACFALGEPWRDSDTPAVRKALLARLDDPHDDTRCAALVGLAHRGDHRVLPYVTSALSRPSGEVFTQELVAAGALGEASLHALVVPHVDGWESEEDLVTAEAVGRLTDPGGPGGDLFDELAEECRRRSRGEAGDDRAGGAGREDAGADGEGGADGGRGAAWDVMAEMLRIAPGRRDDVLEALLTRLAGDGPGMRVARAALED